NPAKSALCSQVAVGSQHAPALHPVRCPLRLSERANTRRNRVCNSRQERYGPHPLPLRRETIIIMGGTMVKIGKKEQRTLLAEWLLLVAGISLRQCRLFECAVCRASPHAQTEDRVQGVLEVAEGFADGLASET